MSNTKSLEDYVAKQRLFFTLQEDLVGKTISNFGVYIIPANSERVAVHGEEFGDKTFFRTIQSIPEPQRRDYFIKNCEPAVFERIEHNIANSLNAPNMGRSRSAALKPIISEKAKELAWGAFLQVSDPYSKNFTNAKLNAGVLLAKHADPTTLLLAIDGPNPYQIFLSQDDDVKDVYLRTSPQGKTCTDDNFGRVDLEYRRIFISTGKYYPLGAPKDTVKHFLDHGAEKYENNVAETIRHEFGHLIMEYEEGVYTESHQVEATHLLWEDANRISYMFVQLITRASAMSANKLIMSDSDLTRYFYLRGLNPESLSAEKATETLNEDLKTISTVLAPCVDFRKLGAGKFLDEEAKNRIAQAFTDYKPVLRITETHSRLHQLSVHLPAS